MSKHVTLDDRRYRERVGERPRGRGVFLIELGPGPGYGLVHKGRWPAAKARAIRYAREVGRSQVIVR